MRKVLVNCLGGLSQTRKSVVRLTDRPDMTKDVYHGHKTRNQQQQSTDSRRAVVSTCQKYVNSIGSLSLPRNSVVMNTAVYHGR